MRVLFILIMLILGSCQKFPEPPILEDSKYYNEVTNSIIIDSVQNVLIDISYCSVYVHFNFDEASFVAEWDSIDFVEFEYLGNMGPPRQESFYYGPFEGQVITSPENSFTGTTYNIRHRIMLKNGRASEWKSYPEFVTPTL